MPILSVVLLLVGKENALFSMVGADGIIMRGGVNEIDTIAPHYIRVSSQTPSQRMIRKEGWMWR